MKLIDKNKKIIRNALIIIILIYVFGMCLSMAINTEYNSAPDEDMKYDVCRYIYNNSKLPHGGDESIRSAKYGISYAFMPILSYIFSAVFMRVFDIFSNSFTSLVIYARLVSVVAITVYAFFCIKISEKLFKGIYKWLFVALSILLPQLLYLGSYINNDSMAVLSISIIIFAWIIGLEENWNWKSCILLGIGIGICSMAYYNAYGYILTSVILYLYTCFKNKMNIKEFLKKGLLIAGIALAIGGWWFIRSFILYDGDIFAIKTQREYGQKYAIEELKPSNRTTPANQGEKLLHMLTERGWINITTKSFIGYFGWMSILMSPLIYNIYISIGIVGILGVLLGGILYLKNRKKNNSNNEISSNRKILNIIFIVNIFITLALSIYYSYYMDYQPQGRYLMPMIIPFMYFITTGIKTIIDMIIKNDKIKNIVISIFIIMLAIMVTYISIEYVIKVL